MFREVVVVEGIHDQQKLQSIFPGIECLLTRGSEISDATLQLIARANETRGVILFLDPDHPGRKILNRILETVPLVKVAFLRQEDAISKNHRKVGVEHARESDIRSALKNLFECSTNASFPKVTPADLTAFGLINRQNSAQLRKKVCSAMNLPPCNGKTLVRYANMFRIPLAKIAEVIS